MRTYIQSVGVVCAATLILACSGSTSVRPISGTYDLVSIDSRPDPQPLYPGTTTPQLVGGTLTVGPDTLNVTLSLQSVDSTGRPIGDIEPAVYEIPYTRHGDTLVTSNNNSVVSGDPLLLGGDTSADVGAVIGSDVQLTLVLGVQSITGFTPATHQYLFAPAR